MTFDDVSFGYDPDEPVLTDVSLDIASGKVAGLLGRTGSGKMTISRLLFRPASSSPIGARRCAMPIKSSY